MLGKKGQPSGASAASLIIVVMSFILIFILFIPSEEREKLLEEDEEELAPEERDFGVLLDDSPGTLTALKDTEFEHRIPSFNILTEREDVILKSVESVFVESNGAAARTIPVFADSGAENGRLAFSVVDHGGLLTVKFNEEEVFRGEVRGVIQPISLGRMQEENTVEFAVDSPPAWKFWERNFYEIRNVRVTGTVERAERQEAVNTFFMSKEEADPLNIDDSFIIYLVDCRVREAGRLDVFLNGQLLSSKVPDCGSLEKTSISPTDFVAGRNELRFAAREGRFLVDQIFVKTKLRKPISPVFFFDLNESVFRRIEQDKVNASIILTLIDDRERKNAVIDVNNHRIFLDTTQKEFSRNIDPFVVEGSNFVRIEPEKTLHVVNLKVVLDCKRKSDCV